MQSQPLFSRSFPHPYSCASRQYIHKAQKAKKTVYETIHNCLFPIFIHSYSPASPPAVCRTNVAKITSSEQMLLYPKGLCTNVSMKNARSKHSYPRQHTFTKPRLISKAPTKYTLYKITSHFSSKNTKYFTQNHMAIQLLTITIISYSCFQAEWHKICSLPLESSILRFLTLLSLSGIVTLNLWFLSSIS